MYQSETSILVPTLNVIPDDLAKHSIFARDSKSKAGYSILTDIAMHDYLRTVEPVSTLTIGESGILHTLRSAISELWKHQTLPTTIAGNPQWAEEIVSESPIAFRNDDDDLRNGYQIEFGGAKFYGNIFIPYTEGLYLLDDSMAMLYVAGDTYAYWNIPPFTAHIVKEQ